MANTNITGLGVRINPTGSEWSPVQATGETAQRVTLNQIGDLAFRRLFPAAIEYVIDGGGGNINAQVWGYLEVPFNATVSAARLLANGVGSITVDIWKCTYAQFDAGATHPVAGDSICGGAPPAIATAAKATATLTNWSTALVAGDIIAFNVPATASGISRVTLSLDLTRNSAS